MTPPSPNTPVEVSYAAWSESTNPSTSMLGCYVAVALASFGNTGAAEGPWEASEKVAALVT
jgi:hypothetical protein